MWTRRHSVVDARVSRQRFCAHRFAQKYYCRYLRMQQQVHTQLQVHADSCRYTVPAHADISLTRCSNPLLVKPERHQRLGEFTEITFQRWRNRLYLVLASRIGQIQLLYILLIWRTESKVNRRFITQSTTVRFLTQSTTARFITQSTTGRFITQSTTVRFLTQSTTARFITQTTTARFITQTTTARFITQLTTASSDILHDFKHGFIFRNFF